MGNTISNYRLSKQGPGLRVAVFHVTPLSKTRENALFAVQLLPQI